MPKGHKTFLVIEDSADDAVLIQRAFESLESCQAVITRNLSEARAYLEGAGMYSDREQFPPPNAVITDLHLGLESGVEFLKWIQSSEFKGMPVYVLSGTASSIEARAAKQLGAIEVFRKPTRFEELQAMLADVAAKLCV